MGEIADDVVSGFSCSGCGIYFRESHGYPVLCRGCYRNVPKRERPNALAQATIPELGTDDAADRAAGWENA